MAPKMQEKYTLIATRRNLLEWQDIVGKCSISGAVRGSWLNREIDRCAMVVNFRWAGIQAIANKDIRLDFLYANLGRNQVPRNLNRLRR
jgi:hypothetical protein